MFDDRHDYVLRDELGHWQRFEDRIWFVNGDFLVDGERFGVWNVLRDMFNYDLDRPSVLDGLVAAATAVGVATATIAATVVTIVPATDHKC